MKLARSLAGSILLTFLVPLSPHALEAADPSPADAWAKVQDYEVGELTEQQFVSHWLDQADFEVDLRPARTSAAEPARRPFDSRGIRQDSAPEWLDTGLTLSPSFTIAGLLSAGKFYVAHQADMTPVRWLNLSDCLEGCECWLGIYESRDRKEGYRLVFKDGVLGSVYGPFDIRP